MNRSLDSNTQPSGSPLPEENARRYTNTGNNPDDYSMEFVIAMGIPDPNEISEPLPPMESEADFFARSPFQDWPANRSTYTPEPVEDPHTSPLPVISYSPLPPTDITPAPIQVFKISSIPFAFY